MALRIAALSFAAAMALLTIAVATGWGPLARLDVRVADWGYGQTYGHTLRTRWWVEVATWGQPFVLRILMLVVALVLAMRRQLGLTVWVVALVAAENLVAPGFKHVLNRPRPQWTHPIMVEHSLSFPSGHATAAACFCTAVLLISARLTGSVAGRTALRALVIVVALVICADRVLVGVHYLSDVVGGVLLGALLCVLAWLAMAMVQARRHRRRPARHIRGERPG